MNAEELTCLLMDRSRFDLESFFLTKEGLIKHKGIAEQIGRMLLKNTISEDQAIDFVEECIDEYNAGESSKEIEKRLRRFRLSKEGER